MKLVVTHDNGQVTAFPLANVHYIEIATEPGEASITSTATTSNTNVLTVLTERKTKGVNQGH